jgi:hypothetical protein
VDVLSAVFMSEISVLSGIKSDGRTRTRTLGERWYPLNTSRVSIHYETIFCFCVDFRSHCYVSCKVKMGSNRHSDKI